MTNLLTLSHCLASSRLYNLLQYRTCRRQRVPALSMLPATRSGQRLFSPCLACLPASFKPRPSLRAAVTEMAAPPEAEVLQQQHGQLAVAVLNRPRALNALNVSMIEDLYGVYRSWHSSPAVASILLKGAGGKAFCAGGDVKAVAEAGRSGNTAAALRFFKSEYKLNYLIARLDKPHVALIDGITMGGGAGLSVHGTFRVATERTLFAMPECAIGLFPDVGGSHFLPRLPGALGLYLGLTGARLHGVDVRHAGLATHFVPSRLVPDLEHALAQLGAQAYKEGAVGRVLHEFEGRHALPQGKLGAQRERIDTAFGGASSVEEVYEACRQAGGQWGADAVAMMEKGSPLSQRLVFEQLRRGATMPLDECLRMEYRMVHHMILDQQSDFYEGVHAVLVARSGAARWRPATLAEVPAEAVQRFFQALPPQEELQLSGVGEVSRPRL